MKSQGKMKKLRFSASVVGVLGLAFLVLFGLNSRKATAQASTQIPLPGSAIPQFVDELPSIHTIVDNGTPIELQMTEYQSKVLPTGYVPPGGAYTGTWVWSYLTPAQAAAPATVPSYITPVIAATRGTPTEIKFVNNLPTGASTNVLAWKNSVDQTLHWADPLNNEVNIYSKDAAKGLFPAPGSVPASHYVGHVPTVVHLHGGEVPPVLDGGPDGWVTNSVPPRSGHGYYTKGGLQGPNAGDNTFTYRYPNSQEAANIWFHPHALGITRLNVYAGLAAAYVILDPPNAPANLPGGRDAYGELLIPLVIQDRMFDTNGQFFFPADSAAGVLWSPNPQHPYWVPEFEGDAIVVNGKTWPTVGTAAAPLEAKRYRFLFLNGSNARTYELFLINQVTGAAGPPMWVIGTDGGFLDKPAMVAGKLVIMPGERYDVIIDFAGFANQTILMRNSGRTPYPKGPTPMATTLGRIVELVVGPPPAGGDASFDPAAAGATVRPTPMVRLADPVAGTIAPGLTVDVTRQLTLNEVMGPPVTVTDPVTGALTAYPGGPLEVLMNNTRWDGMRWNATAGVFEPVPSATTPVNHPLPPPGGATDYYYTEFPVEGDFEVWDIVNISADAHPIHLHLVQFQLINRQNFNFNKYNKAYNAAFPGGAYIGAYGPPLDYFAGNPRAVGGNPDIIPYLQGPAMPPLPEEAGWKDTVVAYPSQVTRLAVRYAPTDIPANAPKSMLYYPFDPNGGHGYVWHCHILDHEDNEMMRPTSVVPNPLVPAASRTYLQGTHY